MSKTGVISASLRTEPRSAQAANSQPKPNDAFVHLQDFVFGDDENLASLKLQLSDPWNAASRREWRNRQWGFAERRISVFWLLRDDLLKVFDAVFGEGRRFVVAGVIHVSAISGSRIGASF